jgi:hypothetical protein
MFGLSRVSTSIEAERKLDFSKVTLNIRLETNF